MHSNSLLRSLLLPLWKEQQPLLLMSICYFYSTAAAAPFFFFFPFYSNFIDLASSSLEVIQWAMMMMPRDVPSSSFLNSYFVLAILQLQIVAQLRECSQQFRDRPLGAGWRKWRRRIGWRSRTPFPPGDSLPPAPLARPLQFGSPLHVIISFLSH